MLTQPAASEGRCIALRVSDLRQWIYCPRVLWWTHVCPVGKVASFKMRQGMLKEQRLQRLQKRRTLHAFGLRAGTVQCNVNLHSSRLELSGRLDLLIRVGPFCYPVEIKTTSGPVRLNHRLQLAGYALLLEDLYGYPVSHGYVLRLPADEAERIEIDEPMRAMTRQTIAAVRSMIASESFPPASCLSHCADCEYRLYCGDVLGER